MEKVNIIFRGKNIPIDKKLYTEMKERMFDFSEEDCNFFLEVATTSGDLDTGFSTPDIETLINNSSEAELSHLIEEGAKAQRKVMA